jgi:hypothetical protein
MEQKPMLSYILIVMWIVVGILFFCQIIAYSINYFDQLDSVGSLSGSQFEAQMSYSYLTYMILYLIIVIFSFLLAYGTFMKKSGSWLIGLMLSSFLAFYAYLGIQSIGMYIIMDYLDNIFATAYSSISFITFILMIVFVPCLILILTRPNIKAYFGKT